MQMNFINKNLPTETSNRNSRGLSVFVQDQTTRSLSVPFLKERSSTTLASDTVADGINRDVELSPGHGALVGDILELADTSTGSLFMQSQITAVNVNTITLDQPINRVYTAAGSVVVLSNDDMNVNGLVTPQVFSILPLPNQAGDMVRIIFEMRDDADMDFTTFGGLASLANGCVLRVNNGDGTYRNLFNIKNNGDIIEQCFDYSFLQPKQGGTIKGFSARLTWGGQSKHGVVIRLDGTKGEALEVVVQDDLTGLTRFHVTAQGHELQE